MKQTAVEWFSNKAYELFEQYSEGKFDRIELNKRMLDATNEAKAMEKESQLDLIRFMRISDKMGKSVEDLYEEFCTK